jgi:branched-chain amino acid transport system substrate-binding protein
MPRKCRKPFVLLVLALVCAVAGACSPAAGCALLPKSTKPVIKIGLVGPFEGRYRALGYEALAAVKLAVQQRNAQGGVAGAMVELVALNDDDVPDASAQRARELALDTDLLGAIGPFSPAALEAAAPVYDAYGVPLITPATCTARVTDRGVEGVYCLGLDEDALVEALGARLGPGLQAAVAYGEGGAFDGFPALGLPVIEAEEGAWVDGGQDADAAQVYLYDGAVLSAANLLLAMRREGANAPLWGGPSLARVQLPQIAGPAASGSCYVVAAPPEADLSPGSAFAVAYAERAGSAPGPWAGLAYDAANVLLDAVARAGASGRALTRDSVRARLDAAPGPDGLPLFVDGRRAAVGVTWYCYDQGTPYPGRRVG